jgi:hypothetical protein
MFSAIWLKTWPKLLVILAGVGLFAVAVCWLSGDVKNLLVNVASALIAVPLIFIFYEVWRDHSKKRLNHSVYDYAQNEMSLGLLKVKDDMRFLIDGLRYYFEAGDVVIDDAEIPMMKIEILDHAKVRLDEEGKPYRLKDRDPSLSDEEPEDVLDYERELMPGIIMDTHYLGYQLKTFDLKSTLARLEGLMANGFVMERLSDDKTQVIVSLMQTLKRLDGFIDLHDDLFVLSNLKYDRLFTDKLSSGEVTLDYREMKGKRVNFEQVLDIQPGLTGVSSKTLLGVYVVNPDYYYIFADLITDVLEFIAQWKTVSGNFVVDYQAARMGGM